MAEPRGILLCGHGSPYGSGTAETLALATAVQALRPDDTVRHGFLEFQSPDLPAALAALGAHRFRRIDALPLMLLPGRHVRHDIPEIVARFREANPRIETTLAGPLDPAMLLPILAARIAEADPASRHGARGGSALLLVGRGARDPAANDVAFGMTRTLRDALGFGTAETAFAGSVAPDVGSAANDLLAQGWRRLVVVPYLLFAGALTDRIAAAAASAARSTPEAEIVVAGPIGPDPVLAQGLAEALARQAA